MHEHEELSKIQLTSHVVHNLNQNPEMPFDDRLFDACTLSFSFQYLTQPVAVLRDLARLLKPGGACHIAFSNRLFPTKAVFCWQTATDSQRAELVTLCLDESGLYETPSALQVVAPTGVIHLCSRARRKSSFAYYPEIYNCMEARLTTRQRTTGIGMII